MQPFPKNTNKEQDVEREEEGFVGDLPIYAMPGHLVRRMHQIAVSLFMEETKAFGITPVQYAALVAVRHRPGIDQRSLSRAIAFDRSTIGDVVIRLEKKGLFRREDGAEDRRVKKIFLTPLGNEVLDGMTGPVDRSQKEFLAVLSEGERMTILFLMERLVRLNNRMSRAPLLTTGELE
jgi:DNA-binding MarR family transcriptional regulator